MLFDVYITKASVTRDGDPANWRTVFYHRCVRSDSRLNAVKKCLPDISKKVLPQVDKSIKFVSIFVGRKGSVTGAASRLHPVKITRKGELVHLETRLSSN